MNFNRKNLPDDQLLELYRRLLFPRLIEEKMLVLLRQNQISKWFSGIGQEAIAEAIELAGNALMEKMGERRRAA